MNHHPESPDPELSSYHDDELPPAARAEVEQRLADSPRLAEELHWYQRLGGGLRHGVPTTAPAGLRGRIMAAVRTLAESDHPLVSLTPFMTRLAVAAAVLLLVASAVFWLQQDGGAPDQPEGPRLVQIENQNLMQPVQIVVPRTKSPMLSLNR